MGPDRAWPDDDRGQIEVKHGDAVDQRLWSVKVGPIASCSRLIASFIRRCGLPCRRLIPRCSGRTPAPCRRLLGTAGATSLKTARIAAASIATTSIPSERDRLRSATNVSVYCPHLDPIERLWGLMHRHCTHNKCYAGFKDFTRVVLTFLREKVPRNWHVYCDQVTDNFRVIDPVDFRVLV